MILRLIVLAASSVALEELAPSFDIRSSSSHIAVQNRCTAFCSFRVLFLVAADPKVFELFNVNVEVDLLVLLSAEIGSLTAKFGSLPAG